MAQNIGTVLTKKKSKANLQLEEICDKENLVKVVKSPVDIDSNLEALRQHQKAKLVEIQRQQEKILAITSNRTVAEQRGKKAEFVLKQKQFSNAIDSQKFLRARMEALKVERERAGFIASLPPPSKDSPPFLLDKFSQNPEVGKRPFFKSIREPASQQRDARMEALMAHDQELKFKESRRERIEEMDVKGDQRFNQALKKEQLANCHKEVMDDLEKVYRADRMKQQQNIGEVPLAKVEKKTVSKVQEVNKLENKNREESSERAVMELGIDLDLKYTDDIAKRFVTQRRRKKKGNSTFNDTTLDFQGIDWTVSGTQHDDLDGLYLNDEETIQNGMNISLVTAKSPKGCQINLWNDAKLEGKPVATTATQTVESNLPNLPIQDLNASNNPLSSSMLQKYEEHLILQAKRGKFFASPKLSSIKTKSTESIQIPFTPNEAFSSSTTIGSSTIKSHNSLLEVESTSPSYIGLSSILQPLPKPPLEVKLNSPTTIGSSSIASSTPTIVVESEPEQRDEGCSTSSGSTKLSQQIKKVLEKCIGSDPRLAFNFQPKRPERFFKEITLENYEPRKDLKERANQRDIRHRIFPEVKENIKPITESEMVPTLTKPPYCNGPSQTSDSKLEKSMCNLTNVIKPLKTEAVGPNNSPNLSLPSKSSVSSSNSFSDSRTRTMQQAPNSDFKISPYIQHKFLSEKIKNGLDQPIETIDDLREILSLLPSGLRLEECLRSRPPVSYPQWVDEDNEPHELSTIAEVDTPHTSINCSRELIFPNKVYENVPSLSSYPEKRPLVLHKSGGFFDNCSIEDSLNHARLSSKLENSNSQLTKSSVKSNTTLNQPRWEDLLKQNCKLKMTNLSPNLEDFNLQQVKCQSTPVKDSKITCDEDDLMAVNLTLIGPEITVSSMRGSILGHPNTHYHSTMSESLLSFLKHEEEANEDT